MKGASKYYTRGLPFSLFSMKKVILHLIISTLWVYVFAQPSNLGTAFIKNYPRTTYLAGTQNWDIAQDNVGRVYFANNDGLLVFDGKNWETYPIGNRTIVRSLALSSDGKIYVGGQGEFGYFQPDDTGNLIYHSLKSLFPPENSNFEDVWDILIRPEGLFCRTNQELYVLKDGKITILLKDKPLSFMGVLEGKVLVQEEGSKLHLYENGKLHDMASTGLPNGIISSLLNLPDGKTLIVTLKNGLFTYNGSSFEPWKTPHDTFLKQNSFYCATYLRNGNIALGTTQNGVVIMNPKRQIVQHLNKGSSLQNNTVLSIFSDRSENLWLGLDAGIDYAMINSPQSLIFPDGKQEGTGYTIQIFNGKIYFGTNNGLYVNEWRPHYNPTEKINFRRVKNSTGQVWNLTPLENELLMGHHEGAFAIRNEVAEPIFSGTGAWAFVETEPGVVVAGLYNGLVKLKKNNGWQFDQRYKGMSESCRLVVKDSDSLLWVAHPYRGIYRIGLKSKSDQLSINFYNSSNGLPSDNNNYLFDIAGKAVFTGEHGVFRFDSNDDAFIADNAFADIFTDKTRIKYLRQDKKGNIWYVADEETGFLQVQENALQKSVRRVPIPELRGKLVGGFEYILPVDDQNVFIATEKGFIHLNPSKYLQIDTSLRIVLHEVSINSGKDSTIYGGYSPIGAELKVPLLSHETRSFRFIFSATDYESEEFTTYSYYLKGLENDWSNWTLKNDISYPRLSPGTYSFHVKAKGKQGYESEAVTYTFEIEPPWYSTRLAYSAYLLLVIGLVTGMVIVQRRKYEREKELLKSTHRLKEEQHQVFARKSEEEISRLIKEKFEVEIKYKTQELATATMRLVQKSDILSTIQKAIEKLHGWTKDDPKIQMELSKILKLVESNVSLNKDWEQFSSHFDQVHIDFLHKLSEQYPKISPNDLKLCAYLRMNLTTKEIATLMNISVRGVEASRYRLRKKLNLPTEANLTDYLLKI